MRTLRKPVYFAAGCYTVSLGSGRPEFNPKKNRPGLEHYIVEAGRGTISQIDGRAELIDEGVIGNFVGSRFCRQSHLAAMIPAISPALQYKPCIRVEGACATGGLALATAMKSVLSDLADIVLVIGVEIQNTVKAVYGADYLAEAGYAPDRREGDAYYFPGKFARRAGAYFEKFGPERTREAMAHWYKQAIENARTCPEAQEYHNNTADLVQLGMTPPNPKTFLPHLNVFDCSKVSDGAAAILCASEEGLRKLGIPREKAVKVAGVGQAEADLTREPEDLTRLDTSRHAAETALRMSGFAPGDIGVLEIHDCFTITAILMLEAGGFAGYGEGGRHILEGGVGRTGSLPVNPTGGLIGYGHPTGATGVRQMVDLWKQLTGRAKTSQVPAISAKPRGMMLNMGGNDRTVVSIVVERVA